MNKDEFKKITAEVITNAMDDMEKEGLSGMSLVITTMTMSMFASKLEETLFDESDSLEIDKEC